MNEKAALDFLLYRSWLANRKRMPVRHQKQLYGADKVQDFRIQLTKEKKALK